MVDLNAESSETAMSDFMDIDDNLKNLVKHPICFKNHNRSSCIVLILANERKSLHSSIPIETDTSDFHKMLVTVLKQYFKKQKPVKSHKVFCNYGFWSQLPNEFNFFMTEAVII